jgi:hypothetical protein
MTDLGTGTGTPASPQGQFDLIPDRPVVSRQAARERRSAQRRRRRTAAPTGRSGRRSGVVLYALATVLFVAGLVVLAWNGYRTSLEIRGGNELSQVTDPTKPGYEAQVRPTPTHLLVTTDDAGRVVDAALIVEGAGRRGGAVVLIPGVTVVQGEAEAQSLAKMAETQGMTAMVDAIQRVLGIGVTDAVVLDPAGIAALFEPSGPLLIDNADSLVRTTGEAQKEIVFPAGPLTLEPGRVAEYLAFVNEGESEVNRTVRAQVVWEAWMAQLAATPVTRPETVLDAVDGDTQVDLGTIIDELAAGTVSFQQLPLERVPVPGTNGFAVYRPDDAEVAALISRLVPFPASAFPGQRPRVVVLNGTSDTDAALRAAPPIVAAGGQIVVIGNATSFGLESTRVEYHAPRQADAARRIAEALGVPAAVAGEQTEARDVTVTLGADFRG